MTDQYKSLNTNQRAGMSLKRSHITSPLNSGPYNDIQFKQNFKSNTQKLDFEKLNNNNPNYEITKNMKNQKSRRSPFTREISDRLHFEGHYQNKASGKNQYLTSRDQEIGYSDGLLSSNTYKKTNTYNPSMLGKKNNKSINFSKEMTWNKQ